jgi:hypothetical protein
VVVNAFSIFPFIGNIHCKFGSLAILAPPAAQSVNQSCLRICITVKKAVQHELLFYFIVKTELYQATFNTILKRIKLA